RRGGHLEEVDRFDAHFFGISAREAAQMDPQQRLLLEVAWEALENAGRPPETLAGGRTGVFIGISCDDYARTRQDRGDHIDAYSAPGAAFSMAANRLSYQWDLRGPSMAVDTACSSSLVAVHQACQSLRRGECDLALAGGVNLILSPGWSISFTKARMLSPDGRCKAFDADADGYVRGEGCGVLVLKPLADAQRDRDDIVAVLKGSAVNQDGRTNGLTAPNGLSQEAVIAEALADARVEPARIDLVEAHGAGTSLGDPIEMNALKNALTPGRPPDRPCRISSVKTNIGHLEAAAGVMGLIKTALSLRHEEMPPHLHLKKLNPHIRIGDAPLSIPTTSRPWPRGDRARLAGVSSFGFGGTNAHVILSEAPLPRASKEVEAAAPPRELPFTISAKSDAALAALAKRYIDWLERRPETPLADLCFSANTGRARLDHRLAVVADSTARLRERLRVFTRGRVPDPFTFSGSRVGAEPGIAFLFPDHGSPDVDAAAALRETWPLSRRTADRCREILDRIQSKTRPPFARGGANAP
ncbi:MAG: polyketide synthase, partial [bacterium]|nr:polyketide synthase [bacterium]